jgi:hypothetical protein
MSTSNGTLIDLSIASTMTASYRQSNPGAIQGFLFDSSLIQQIMSQAGTVGVRFYLGMNAVSGSNQLNLIMVGVDANGNDQTNGLLAERATVCPPRCGTSNTLNGN